MSPESRVARPGPHDYSDVIPDNSVPATVPATPERGGGSRAFVRTPFTRIPFTEDIMAELLMPKATAVWLVDNTALTFDQIAKFTKMHPLEVKAIADGEAQVGVKGLDPVQSGQLSREMIEEAEKNSKLDLKLAPPKVRVPEHKRKGPRYTPLLKRQERGNAILWLVRNHPELKDGQISKLIGTTKSTIQSIRDRTHWNQTNLEPVDPVTLGFCRQIDLDMEVEKANRDKVATEPGEPGDSLLPASATENLDPASAEQPDNEELDADAVFARLSSLKGDEKSE